MKRSFALTVVLITLLSVITAAACHAEYDKLFRFKNRTTTTQDGVYVVLNALELTTAFYADATYCPWGNPTVGLATINGIPCTTLTYAKAGTSMAVGVRARVGWNTADQECRLSGLYWRAGTTDTCITDASEYGTVPGGGALTKVRDNWVWTIYNDTGGDLAMTNVEWDVFEADDQIKKADLVEVATNGIIGERLKMAGAPAATAATENAAACADFADGNTVAANAAWGRARAAADLVTGNPSAARGNGNANRRRDMARIKTKMGARGQNGPPLEDRPGNAPARLAVGANFTIEIPVSEVKKGDSLVIHGQIISNVAGADGGFPVLVDWVDRVPIP